MAPEYIRVQGNRFTRDGKPILLRGLGVGSWLNLEHFMMGVPGWDGALRQCLDQHRPGFMRQFTETFFTREDARYIRSLGVNFIRVPINHHLFWNDEQDTPNRYGFDQLERLAGICQENGLYFLPDLHTTPGGQNPDWHSECRTGTPQFWAFRCLQSHAVQILAEIAERLRDCPMLLGYDLLNEPVLPPGRADLLNGFYRDAIAAIRRRDPHHIVFLEGDRFSMDFADIEPPEDDNWAYAFHFYPGVWEEKLLDPALPEQVRTQAFADALAKIVTSMGDYRGPLLCGEMGYELSCLDTDFGLELTRTTIEALEACGSGWCLWCYKDARFMGLVYPAENSGWMKLVRSVRAQWDHHRASRLGQAAVEEIGRLCPYPLTKEEAYGMQFVVRAMVAEADVAHVLAPALEKLSPETGQTLPEDFALARCEHNTGLENLLRDCCRM